MMVEIEIRGLDVLVVGFTRVGQIAEEELQRASDVSLLQYVADLKRYPPERVGSGYRRTKTLGRNWTLAQPVFRTEGGGWMGSIGNITPYAALVQGYMRQALVHRGRWLTDDGAVEANYENTKLQFEEAGRRIAMRIAAGG